MSRGRPLIELASCQDAKRLPVLGACGVDDLGRKLRAGRGFRPANSLEIVAHKLFVERRLRTAGIVFCGGPKAGGIRRQGFVDPQELIIQEAEFKFRVGEDDAARLCVSLPISVAACSNEMFSS